MQRGTAKESHGFHRRVQLTITDLTEKQLGELTPLPHSIPPSELQLVLYTGQTQPKRILALEQKSDPWVRIGLEKGKREFGRANGGHHSQSLVHIQPSLHCPRLVPGSPHLLLVSVLTPLQTVLLLFLIKFKLPQALGSLYFPICMLRRLSSRV